MSSPTLRLFAFFLIFISCAVLEFISPRRKLSQSKGHRWIINISIHLLNTALVYFLMGAAAYTTAQLAKEEHWGLMSLLAAPQALSIPLTILILDFVIYLQHIAFHLVPLFWRFHRVHHTDIDFDVTTGIRFHPIEIVISLVIKMVAIVLIGADPFGVLIFEILLNATSLFNHANIFIPIRFDQKLRWIFVTPDIHRVHHSVSRDETDSNFGFSVTWWDMLCRTYRDQPREPHAEMKIGLSTHREAKKLRFVDLLALPALKLD